MQGNAVNWSCAENTKMITGLQLTKNLCYIVLDCDEHDGKLRRDLEHKERSRINGLVLSQLSLKHVTQKEAKPLG